MTDHTYAGHTAAQIRMMAEVVKYIDAATVLAPLDRIAELEAGMPATRTEQKKRQRHMRGVGAAGAEIPR